MIVGDIVKVSLRKVSSFKVLSYETGEWIDVISDGSNVIAQKPDLTEERLKSSLFLLTGVEYPIATPDKQAPNYIPNLYFVNGYIVSIPPYWEVIKKVITSGVEQAASEIPTIKFFKFSGNVDKKLLRFFAEISLGDKSGAILSLLPSNISEELLKAGYCIYDGVNQVCIGSHSEYFYSLSMLGNTKIIYDADNIYSVSGASIFADRESFLSLIANIYLNGTQAGSYSGNIFKGYTHLYEDDYGKFVYAIDFDEPITVNFSLDDIQNLEHEGLNLVKVNLPDWITTTTKIVADFKVYPTFLVSVSEIVPQTPPEEVDKFTKAAYIASTIATSAYASKIADILQQKINEIDEQALVVNKDIYSIPPPSLMYTPQQLSEVKEEHGFIFTAMKQLISNIPIGALQPSYMYMRMTGVSEEPRIANIEKIYLVE